MHKRMKNIIKERGDAKDPASQVRIYDMARENGFTWPRFSAGARYNAVMPIKVLGEGAFGMVRSIRVTPCQGAPSHIMLQRPVLASFFRAAQMSRRHRGCINTCDIEILRAATCEFGRRCHGLIGRVHAGALASGSVDACTRAQSTWRSGLVPAQYCTALSCAYVRVDASGMSGGPRAAPQVL